MQRSDLVVVKKKKSNGSNGGDYNELKGAAHEQDAFNIFTLDVMF